MFSNSVQSTWAQWKADFTTAVHQRNATALAQSLTAFVSDDTVDALRNSQYAGVDIGAFADVASEYNKYINSNLDVMHAAYSRVVNAFAHQSVLQEDWMIATLRLLCSDLTALALQDNDPQRNASNSVNTLDLFSKLASIFFNEINRDSSKIGSRGRSFFVPVYFSFRICFKLNELTRCPKIIEQVDLVLNLVDSSEFPSADFVTYNYWLGRLRLINHEFEDADRSLSVAWTGCPDHYPRQKRQILLYLTATRLVLGKPPSSQLLQDYNLDGLFGDLISAASVGNFAEYEHLLQMRCTWLMRYRLYGIMKYRLKVAMFRNLMKNTWMALNQTRTISFWQFWNACVFAGAANFTIEDAECILVTLVDLGYMKGYLNHAKGVVVLSASPFPPMYEVYK
ncbi:hypothetical protein CcCBS67573_g02981 [Chytriomyces confervae]|uniref:Uncharacterized protein n=1 Tax=Chytriomyces confervae TaxID=246404 RepID=A0A507FK05_9FUNG|nr:PCI domain-containing protein 2 [Chytriomyces hyalinus]TPX75748.1 hypothetical protein CcCBS67573_g02981 [Chytriomyces confervae]